MSQETYLPPITRNILGLEKKGSDMQHVTTSNRTRSKRGRLALILALLLAICLPATAFGASTPPSASQVKGVINKVSAYEIAQLTSRGANYGDEWAIMALARAGKLTDTLKQQYLSNLSKYLKSNGNSLGSTVTDYDRVILALTAIGVDATDFNGVDLTVPLANLDDITAQGVSGSIYALLALDSHPYTVPKLAAGATGTQATRPALVSDILNQQLTGGGWNWGWGAVQPDPDLTSMAITALTPYAGTTPVDSAISAALTALSSIQNTTGGLLSEWSPVPASESSAQAIVALGSQGIALDDARFVKTGASLYDSLTSFLVSAGSGAQAFVNNVGDPAPDGMATEQGLYALASLWRSLTGASRLYDMSDVSLQPYTSKTGSGSTKTSPKKKAPTSSKKAQVKAPPASSASASAASTDTAATLADTGDAAPSQQLMLVAASLAGVVAALLALSRKRLSQQVREQALR